MRVRWVTVAGERGGEEVRELRVAEGHVRGKGRICVYVYVYIHIQIYPLSAETFEPFARVNENYYTNV